MFEAGISLGAAKLTTTNVLGSTEVTLNFMPVQAVRNAQLRAEASVEPDPVPTGEVKSKTQIIAIYGKGGIGKSFTLANLSYMMAQTGKYHQPIVWR
jgi:Mrp family chromosome partitioning ATPase